MLILKSVYVHIDYGKKKGDESEAVIKIQNCFTIMNDAITALPLNLCAFKDIFVLLYGNMMNIMRQTNNSNFKKYPIYPFIPGMSEIKGYYNKRRRN